MLCKGSHANAIATIVLFVVGVLLAPASAQTETVLHSFCAKTQCLDGALPVAGLVFDKKGNLYGTTWEGGANGAPYGAGVVFKLTPESKEKVLYSFCTKDNCADGEEATSGLVFDKQGNLYGTTVGGGAYGSLYSGGVVFKLTPKRKETVLYSFCAETNCADGSTPTGVVFDQNKNLYGTTVYGGAYGGTDSGGVIFKLTPKGKQTVLYSFCAQTNCADGEYPVAAPTFDRQGNLYGTTGLGGVYGAGVVFKLTPEGAETTLYNFCAQTNCADGSGPEAGLVVDRNGNLYGTTGEGGAYAGGVVFKLTPDGTETVLYSFCAQTKCADGDLPEGALVLDRKGNLYGTTNSGEHLSSVMVSYSKLLPRARRPSFTTSVSRRTVRMGTLL